MNLYYYLTYPFHLVFAYIDAFTSVLSETPTWLILLISIICFCVTVYFTLTSIPFRRVVNLVTKAMQILFIIMCALAFLGCAAAWLSTNETLYLVRMLMMLFAIGLLIAISFIPHLVHRTKQWANRRWPAHYSRAVEWVNQQQKQ